MQIFTDKNHPLVAELLLSGGVGVMRTDTLYGVVAKADNQAAVERIYQLKSRDRTKSPIVLISSTSQLIDGPDESLKAHLEAIWPGPVSVIIPSTVAPVWLSRGNNSVAYRLPADESLRQLLEATGPLIAPSANPEGEPPAISIAEAQEYFGDKVDFYVDEGEVTDNTPSQLLRVNANGDMERLR